MGYPFFKEPEKIAHMTWDSQDASISEQPQMLNFLTQTDDQKLKTYAILDPTLRKAVTGVFDLDTIDVNVRSLFDGRAAEENEEVAPYLVDVTVTATD